MVSTGGIIVKVIGIIIVAGVIASTNAQATGALTYLVLGFLTVGIAVSVLQDIFGNK